jgi:hypothetical protein
MIIEFLLRSQVMHNRVNIATPTTSGTKQTYILFIFLFRYKMEHIKATYNNFHHSFGPSDPLDKQVQENSQEAFLLPNIIQLTKF